MNESNPYSPPKAPVSDIEKAAEAPVPGHVETACLLMWISVGIGGVKALARTSWQGDNPFARASFSDPVVSPFIGLLIGLGAAVLITFWFTRKLRTRRNWMRWLVTVLVVLDVAFLALAWNDYLEMFRHRGTSFLFASTEFTQSLLYAVAVVLLHTRRSREWFEGVVS